MEGVSLDCRGVEGEPEVLAGLCVFVLGANALSGLFLVGRGEVDLLLHEADGEEDTD